MPTYKVTDPNTGKTVRLTGDSPPTEQELENIFSGGAIGSALQTMRDDTPSGATETIEGKTGASFEEPALTFGTAALAEPIAGLAGIAQTLNPFADPGAGERAVAATREALTFQPRTPEGKLGLQKIGKLPPVKAFVEALQFSERLVGDTLFDVGGPIGGAIGSAVPTAVLEAMGLIGLKNLRLGKANFIDRAGKPTKELQKVLDDAGVSFDDLTPQAKAELGSAKQGASAAESVRKSRFEEQGIPFTKGDVSQDFAQLSKEQRLMSMIGDEASEPLRQLKFEQSEAFIRNVDEVVDSLGGARDSGAILKGALEGRLKLLKKEKTALYKEFAETSPDLQSIPIVSDSIADAIPNKQKFNRIARAKPTEAKAVEDLLVEFGIDKDPVKVDKFIKAGNDITPLDIGNFDDFRQGLNIIERADQTGTISNITGPIKTALDNEAGLIDDAVRAAGVTDEGVLAPLTKARQTVRQIKTEFSPQSIAGKLTDFKRDGVTPVIEASKAVDQVMGKNVPIEFLERTLESLNKAGKDGQTAIRSLQASVILKALDDALKAPTRKFGGIETIGTNAFDKSLRAFGDNRLKLLFKDNPGLLKRVKSLQKTSFDLTPPSSTVPVGSGPVNLDIINNIMTKLGRIPVAGEVVNFVKLVTKPGIDSRAIRKAIQAKPSFKKANDLIKRQFPALATALSLGSFDEPLKQVSGESQGRDQGTVAMREEFRGITREREESLAKSLGF